MAKERTDRDVTRLIQAAEEGDTRAAEELLPLVYAELRVLAESRLRQEGPGLTLQPTALVHEAYLRLVGEEDPGWDNRGHFFASAATAMRRILIERARRKASAKHGGGRERVTIELADTDTDVEIEDLLGLDAALTRLQEMDARKGEIVMLRFFAGLSIAQTADALGLSTATVKNEWRFARAWLHNEVARDDG